MLKLVFIRVATTEAMERPDLAFTSITAHQEKLSLLFFPPQLLNLWWTMRTNTAPSDFSSQLLSLTATSLMFVDHQGMSGDFVELTVEE